MTRKPAFEAAWFSVNLLLVLSFVLCIFGFAWEYSTRKYLQGFSDAIIPASSAPIERVETILAWMSHGPARRETPNPQGVSYRDPEETLNYQALLRVCGTATNAFVNLANASGVPARRLLLLDERLVAKHVVAEVRIDNQWIVVDPSYRVIPRGPDGGLLTRDDLANLDVFHYVFQNVPGYNPTLSYERTVHLRLARVPVFGRILRAILGRIAPRWEDSVYVTLLVERLSFTTTTASVLLFFILLLIRLGMRYYSEVSLGIHRIRFRERLWRAFQILLREPS